MKEVKLKEVIWYSCSLNRHWQNWLCAHISSILKLLKSLTFIEFLWLFFCVGKAKEKGILLQNSNFHNDDDEAGDDGNASWQAKIKWDVSLQSELANFFAFSWAKNFWLNVLHFWTSAAIDEPDRPCHHHNHNYHKLLVKLRRDSNYIRTNWSIQSWFILQLKFQPASQVVYISSNAWQQRPILFSQGKLLKRSVHI